MRLRQKTDGKPLVAGDGFKQIGLTLKSARRSQGRSVKDLSDQLRISVDYLTKLEAGEFEELPAPAYVTGFLRSYGRCVGICPDALVSRYMALTNGKGAKPSYKTPMSTRPPQRSAPAIASVLVLCMGLAYGGWFWLKTDSLPAMDTAGTALNFPPDHESIAIDVGSLNTLATVDAAGNNLTNTIKVAAAAPTTAVKAASPLRDTMKKQVIGEHPSELVSSEMTTVEPTDIDSSVDQIAEPGPWKTNLKESGAQMPVLSTIETSNLALLNEMARTQILAAPNLGSAGLPNSNTAIANLRDPTKEIIIRAVAASWVEIVRDNGEEVMARLMKAGDSYVVEGNTRLYLSTGNAGGLMVVIGTDDPLSMGGVGEIVRDLPLVTEKLRKVL